MTDTQQEQDVVDVLSQDHTEAQGLIPQIRASADPKERRDLADILISELVRHSVAEEMFVYPVMQQKLPDGKAVVDHDTQEHKQLERTMKELEGTEAGDPRFDALIDQLEGVLRDHVRDEETEQFPKLRAQVERAELVRLANAVQGAKKIAPTRPHPDAPNNVLFHLLVGPGVGLVDRLRDRLTGRATG